MSRIFAEIRYCLLYLFSMLPLKIHYFFSDGFAFVLEYIARYRFSTVITNISRSFPQLKYKEVRGLASQYYKYMSDLIFESAWDISHSAKKICRIVKVANPELPGTLQKKYNKILVVMGHCGNWEIVSGMCGTAEYRTPDSFASHPIYIVYKEAKDKRADFLFHKLRMHEYRKFKTEGHVVESKKIIRTILTDKDEKATFVMIADQSPKGENHRVINFLNQQTLFMKGPEYVAVKAKMPVVYLSMDRISRGNYLITFTTITEDASKEREGFVTEKYAELLEADINKNKVNWLWSHRRWKKRL